MALNYDLSRVPAEAKTNEGLTTAMIFLTMHIGWGEITEENAADWYARAHLWEAAYGPMLREVDENDPDALRDRPITPEDVRAFIGLTTNVFGPRGAKQETDAAFMRRVAKAILEDAAKAYRRVRLDAVAAEAVTV